MLDRSKTYSHGQLMSELDRLCSNDNTGTLFMVTKQGASASVGIRRGAIVSMAHRGTSGFEAIDELKAIDGCKLNFTPRLLLKADRNLPSTMQILAALGAASRGATSGQSKPAAHARAQAAGAFAHVAPAAMLTLIGRRLEAELEPMFGADTARRLCDEAISGSEPPDDPRKVHALVRSVIAGHVGNRKADEIGAQIIAAIDKLAVEHSPRGRTS